MADQERGIFDDEAPKPEQEQKPEAKELKPAEQEKGFFADDPAPGEKERGIFDDEPRQPEEPKREEEKAPKIEGETITVEVKQPEEQRPSYGQGPEGWKPEVLEREENAALRDQLGPEAMQRTPGDVLPTPDGWKGDGPDLRTPDEMAAGVQLEPEEYTRRSAAEFYDGLREGDRAGGPSKDRELYDLPDLKDRDGFTPGEPATDRDGFAQGKEAPEKTMTGAEIKEYAEQAIETRRQEEKDQFKALDEAKAKGADPQTIEAMKAQVKDTIGDRLTAESLSKSITPDMMNQTINIGELKENMKQDLQKIQSAVQQHKDAHPSQSIQPHISHSMDR